ncbi:MAG: 50S ribosomal protein L9 [marine bacterium B5-7]|nr:MAG: 50S ribosomal protein L9 [marine bacterium B5-7]
MEVIFLERVGDNALGTKSSVSAGYARNFLIPQGKALPATAGNLKEFEARRAELEKQAAEVLAAAQQRAAGLTDLQVSISAPASEEGKLFGSIGAREMADAITAAGQMVEKSEIRLPEGPIRVVSENAILVQLHSDVSVTIEVTVVAAEG